MSKTVTRAQLHREPGGREGTVITVSADGPDRRFGKGLAEKLRVPVMVAQMDEHICLGFARRLQHGKVVAVGVGKNRCPNHGHASDSVIIILLFGEYTGAETASYGNGVRCIAEF